MDESLVSDLKVIVFQLNQKEYAVPVSQVRSIEKIMHITRVPHVNPFVKGVMNLRGVVTPLLDLRVRFGMEEQSYSDSTRVIIVADDDKEVGLIVDGANDVIDIPSSMIEPPPEVVGLAAEGFIKGVANLDRRLLILIDLDKILESDEVKAI
ncbi:purine-binding chemotaxis protein CheW [Bacillus sp. ISL-35]|uniref:chemotaxis protein CheW n=1 Tax=Bacillus sp. ISL-35 TaxID=2819122 RepID=UPI001BE9AC8C|nr:chemotaxis protein CheW [Bacillus sp. ISL-35]MBT2681375.1 purine-binding chemotaxis protein CheW [Bacillus sp. ISL-35]MBT2701842.1 purine-binding chemotaxis protein CheW [Chryseobacterium sp. ISL-80]